MSGDGFRPPRGLANPHIQTILATYVKGGRLPAAGPRHLVPLDDGDRLVLHETTPGRWRAGDPAAVILHGLTGDHRSGGVLALAAQLLRRGVRVFRLDLRGAGAGFRLARGSYHAGCSDDVRAALATVGGLAPASPVWLVGISLGGNVALKLAGEAEAHPAPGLAKVAALNPPTDVHACVELLARPNNRIYEWHFVSELLRAARRRARLFQQVLPRFPHRCRLRDFDDLYTAPRNGFAGVDDYYRRASSNPLIPSIAIPALILTARDDPFIAAGPIERLAAPPNVQVWVSERGGHTAYLGRGGWAERAIAEWLTR